MLYFLLHFHTFSENLKLIISRVSVIEQCQRYKAQLAQQILNALQCGEPVDDLPDDIEDKLPLKSMMDLSHIEDQIEDNDLLRKLVLFFEFL